MDTGVPTGYDIVLLLRFPVCDHILFANLNGCDSEDGLPDTGGTAKFSALCSYLTAALLLGVSRASASKTAQVIVCTYLQCFFIIFSTYT